MTRDLGLSTVQMAWAFSAFTWAYALFEIPGGWMGDRWGARKVLMRIVVWWSFFTAATSWVWNLPSLLVVRALFGSRHLPWSRITGLVPDRRGRVHAVLDNGASVRLPAVSTRDLPRLVAASGQELEVEQPQ